MTDVTGSDPQRHPETGDEVTDAPEPHEARNAALDAVEPDRLLEGEDEDTAYLDDAVHWTNVYTELLDFKRSLLSLAEQRVTTMHDVAGLEVEETDIKVLKAEAARFKRRLDFWQARITALRAPAGTEPA
jgi:hypothetical protein